jgi:hypothetical protein
VEARPDTSVVRLSQRPAKKAALDHDRREAHVVGAEIVGQVQLGRGARLHADRGAVQLLGRIHAQALLHHEALAVVEVRAHEVEAELHVALEGPGRVAGHHVHLARLDGGEALLRRQRNVADLGRIVEHGDRDGPAGVDVEAAPDALAVGLGEAGEAGVHAAHEGAAGLDGVEDRRGGRLGVGGAEAGDRERRAERESAKNGHGTSVFLCGPPHWRRWSFLTDVLLAHRIRPVHI